MSEYKLKKHHDSKRQPSNPLDEKPRTGHVRRAKNRFSGKVSIDQYMEALRKGVILSQ